MKHLILDTSHGPIYLVGRLHTGKRRPLLLVVGGIWAPDDLLHEVVDWFPGVSVLIVPIPGMGGSLTTSWDLATMSRALDEVIALLARDVPVVAFGGSTGCLITLGLQSPEIVRHVVVEPFFHTAPLWPLIAFAQKFIAAQPEKNGAADAADAMLGIRGATVTDRDYSHLLDALRAPTDVLVADLPLAPIRPIDNWPSLTGAADRAALASHPLVTLQNGPPGSGHDFLATPQGVAMVKQTLHQALRSADAAGNGG